jgi:TonB family protein
MKIIHDISVIVILIFYLSISALPTAFGQDSTAISDTSGIVTATDTVLADIPADTSHVDTLSAQAEGVVSQQADSASAVASEDSTIQNVTATEPDSAEIITPVDSTAISTLALPDSAGGLLSDSSGTLIPGAIVTDSTNLTDSLLAIADTALVDTAVVDTVIDMSVDSAIVQHDTTFVVSIIQPVHLQTISNGLETLSSFVYGRHAMLTPDSAYVWHSDLNGEIGRGRSILTSGLVPGPHQLTLTAVNPDSMVATDTIHVLVQDKQITIMAMEIDAPIVNFPEDSTLEGVITIALQLDTSGVVIDFTTLRNTTGDEEFLDSVLVGNSHVTYWAAQSHTGAMPSWYLKEYVFTDTTGPVEYVTFESANPVEISMSALSAGGPGGAILGGANAQALRRSDTRRDGQTIITEDGEWMAGLPELLVPGSPHISIEIPRGFFGGGRPVSGRIQAIIRISPFGFTKEIISLSFETENWVIQDFLRMFRESLFLPLVGVAPRDRIAFCEFEAVGDHFEELRGKSLRGWRQEYPVTFPKLTKGTIPNVAADAVTKGTNGYFYALASVDGKGQVKIQKKLHEFIKDVTGLRGRFLDLMKNLEYEPAVVQELEANTYLFFPMGFQHVTPESTEELRKTYNEGIEKFLKREYDEATKIFHKVISMDAASDYMDIYHKLVICNLHAKDPRIRRQPEAAYWLGLRMMAIYNNFTKFSDLLDDLDAFLAARNAGAPVLSATKKLEDGLVAISSPIRHNLRPKVATNLDSALQTLEIPPEISVAHMSGAITAAAFINKDGEAKDVILQNSFGFEDLDKKVVKFVKSLSYNSANIDSVPIEHWTQVEIPVGTPRQSLMSLFGQDDAQETAADSSENSAADSLAVVGADSMSTVSGDSALSLTDSVATLAQSDTLTISGNSAADSAIATISDTLAADSLVAADSSGIALGDSLFMSGQDTTLLSYGLPDSLAPVAIDNISPLLPPMLYTPETAILPEIFWYTSGKISVSLKLNNAGLVTQLLISDNSMEGDQRILEDALARTLFGSLFYWNESEDRRGERIFHTAFRIGKDVFIESPTRFSAADTSDIVFPQLARVTAPDIQASETTEPFNGLFETVFRLDESDQKTVLPMDNSTTLSQSAIASCAEWYENMDMQAGQVAGGRVPGYLSFRTVFFSDSSAARNQLLRHYVEGYRDFLDDKHEDATKRLNQAALWDIRGEYPVIVSQIVYGRAQSGNFYDMIQTYGKHMRRLAASNQLEAVKKLAQEWDLLHTAVSNGTDFLAAAQKQRIVFRSAAKLLDDDASAKIKGGKTTLSAVLKYPSNSFGARIRGTTEVTVLINEDGNLKHAAVTRSIGDPDYDKAALDAVKRLKYEPAVIDQYTVASWYIIPVPF